MSTSDSSLEGYGVCHAWWEAECVGKVGRVSDRERFRRVGSHRAGESALAAAGLHIEGSAWKVSVNGVDDDLECGGEWSAADHFDEVPAAGLRKELWMPKFWGSWRHSENISILEARALLMSMRRIALTRFGHSFSL